MHIPFCHRRCFYCDFPVVPLGDFAGGEAGPGSSSIQAYLTLLSREIALAPKAPPLSTIYIGGGTPSILSPKQIAYVLEILIDSFGIQNGAEITLEIDPASFYKDDLKEYISIGINRFSLGAQSFDDEVLARIGRRHTSFELFQACEWVENFFRKGELSSWNIDLIQNLPDQDLTSWEKQLKEVLNIHPPHISIYDLAIEKGTVFAWRKGRGELNLPSDEIAADICALTSAMLKDAGFSRYEISNYALPGHTSRHNRVYWSGGGWWGFGLGATSCPWGEMLERPRTRAEYEKWVIKQESLGIDESLKPGKKSSMDLDELFLVGLRRREGIDVEQLAKNWGWKKKERKVFLSRLENAWASSIEKGWLVRKGSRYVLSDPDGMNVSNHILVEMMLWWESLPKIAHSLPSFSVRL